jgi:hypothetical protein
MAAKIIIGHNGSIDLAKPPIILHMFAGLDRVLVF